MQILGQAYVTDKEEGSPSLRTTSCFSYVVPFSEGGANL